MKIVKLKEEYLHSYFEMNDVIKEKSEEYERIKNICRFNNSDSLVIKEEEKVLGFCLSRYFGVESFIGPADFFIEEKNFDVIEKAFQKIISNLPEISKNIYFENSLNKKYYFEQLNNLNFRMTYPTIIFKIPEDYYFPTEKIKIFQLNEFSNLKRLSLIESIDAYTKKEFNGLSYKAEIINFLKKENNFFVAIKNEQPMGFLAYCEELEEYVWGCIFDDHQREYVFRSLVYKIVSNVKKDIKISVNSGYKNFINFLIKERLPIINYKNRFVLESPFQGEIKSTGFNAKSI